MSLPSCCPGNMLMVDRMREVWKHKKKTKNMAEKDLPSYQDLMIPELIHEMRNPLTAIRMANMLLRQKQLLGNISSEEALTYTEVIYNSVERLDKLIKSLLLEKHSDITQKTSINVCSLIEEVLTNARDRILLEHIELKKSYNNGCYIKGDPGKLSLALLNIIINAVEAIHDRKGKIWISVYPTTAQKVYVVVKDNGDGIPQDKLDRVFEPNFTMKQDGIGLGLAKVKAILDAHEAVITVDSQPGIGTAFIIQFKAA